MIKVGITGQAGFIGTHLYNYLGLFPEEFERVPFRDELFEDEKQFDQFVDSCDTIVHLAALNRHNDPDTIYYTNVRLVRQLIESCKRSGRKHHILFSSSTQEERDNPYGRSKLEGREMLSAWAGKNKEPFTGFVIPNVFGPFGNPYYNSVVATFSHQLTHGEKPVIEIDGYLKMIYVGELVTKITGAIRNSEDDHHRLLDHTSEIYVSELLDRLHYYKEIYFDKGIIPALQSTFDLNLFNTFRSYIDPGHFFPFKLQPHTDPRGSFVEVIKLHSGGQVSFSTTKPGITRGNHFHTRKVERFAVIRGEARIELRRIGTDKVYSFSLDGQEPSFVDMPVRVTHNITNTGTEDLYTIFWINEFFDPKDADTYFENVEG